MAFNSIKVPHIISCSSPRRVIFYSTFLKLMLSQHHRHDPGHPRIQIADISLSTTSVQGGHVVCVTIEFCPAMEIVHAHQVSCNLEFCPPKEFARKKRVFLSKKLNIVVRFLSEY